MEEGGIPGNPINSNIIEHQNQEYVTLPSGYETFFRLIEQQFQVHIQGVHAELRNLQDQIAVLRGSQKRKNKTLTEEEELCLDEYVCYIV